MATIPKIFPGSVNKSTIEASQLTNVHIRWMISRDMPGVLQVEEGNYAHYSWSEENFLQCLRQRNCIGYVFESEEKILGFVLYELLKNKFNVLKLAVHPEYHHRGIGTQIANKLISRLSNSRNKITITLRETDLNTQLFLREAGFKAIKVTRSFYEDSGEDAFIMEYHFTECTEQV